jgi:hypothetical protein
MPIRAGLFHLFLMGIDIGEIKGMDGLIPRVHSDLGPRLGNPVGTPNAPDGQ